MAKVGVKLSPPVIEALDRLKGEVREAHGAKASREDVIGALAHGVTPHQLAGMLAEFQKHPELSADTDDT
jgi:hypothetical protein